MYTVHATKKLLDRLKEPVEEVVDEPTTMLGNWYAKPLFWRPQVALFVNERTYLPVLVRPAPATTLLHRFPAALAETLQAHDVRQSFIDAEVEAMRTVNLAKTQSRQVVGVLNELALHANYILDDQLSPDEIEIAIELSQMPFGIMGKSYRFPDQALTAVVEGANDVD